MSELEFLQGEAKVASASASAGLAITVRDGGKAGRYDVLFGGRVIARFLERPEALSCIMGAGGVLTVFASAKVDTRIKIVDRLDPKWRKVFKSKRTARQWIMEGLAGTEGAEQEHYSQMLIELEGGATVLHYN